MDSPIPIVARSQWLEKWDGSISLGDDFERPATAQARVDIDAEHPLEALSPAHGRMAGSVVSGFPGWSALAAPGWGYSAAPAVVGGEDAVVVREVDLGSGHKGGTDRVWR